MMPILRVFAVFGLTLPCAAQAVTATAKVEVDKKIETVRKINNHWWTEDNREITPPQKGGSLWIIGTPKGHNFDFHHHRPVNLATVEQVHLLMSKSTVESIVGQPNFSAGREDGGSTMWIYYAADGTSVMLRFTQDDELSEGHYNKSEWGITARPVQSIEQDLGGKSSFQYFADRSWQKRDPKGYAKFHPNAGPMPTASSFANPAAKPIAPVNRAPATANAAPAASPAPETSKRRISSDLADSVKVGMTRSEVVELLGAPAGGMRILGGESDIETMTYALEPTGELSLSLENGKVSQVKK